MKNNSFTTRFMPKEGMIVKMKKNKGITMISLVIIVVILLILVGISVNTGNNIIKQSQIENLKTNMLLIKVKGKEYVENANFKLGTAYDKITEETERNNRKEKAKEELKGEDITNTISTYNIGISETAENIYYYKLDTQNLIDIGITNVESSEKAGWYIIKYDIVNAEVEVYNTKGIEKENRKYYGLNEIQNL